MQKTRSSIGTFRKGVLLSKYAFFAGFGFASLLWTGPVLAESNGLLSLSSAFPNLPVELTIDAPIIPEIIPPITSGPEASVIEEGGLFETAAILENGRKRFYLPHDSTRDFVALQEDGASYPPGSLESFLRDLESFLKALDQDLSATEAEINRIFGFEPKRELQFRILSSRQFTSELGLPEWTSAMYFNGEISLQVKPGQLRLNDSLKRTIRHEYVHSLIDELSGGRAPAWLEEGLAQLLEGPVNPDLNKEVVRAAKAGEMLPFDGLRDGFHMLDKPQVKLAYGQSLFATRSLVNRHGFPAIARYLSRLRYGNSDGEAFAKTFAEDFPTFESGLQRQLVLWAKSGQKL